MVKATLDFVEAPVTISTEAKMTLEHEANLSRWKKLINQSIKQVAHRSFLKMKMKRTIVYNFLRVSFVIINILAFK